MTANLTITRRTAAYWVGSIWIASLILLIAAGYYLNGMGTIGEGGLSLYLEQINRTYEHFVGAALGFTVASRRRRAEPSANIAAFLAAIAVTLVWSATVAYWVVKVASHEMIIKDAAKEIEQTGARAAWIVAPVMGYFFGRE